MGLACYENCELRELIKTDINSGAGLVLDLELWDRDCLDLDKKSKISVMVLVCRLPSDVFQYFTDLERVIEYINVVQPSKDCISVVVSFREFNNA